MLTKEYLDLIDRVAKVDKQAAEYLEWEAPHLDSFQPLADLFECFYFSDTPQGNTYWLHIWEKLSEYAECQNTDEVYEAASRSECLGNIEWTIPTIGKIEDVCAEEITGGLIEPQTKEQVDHPVHRYTSDNNRFIVELDETCKQAMLSHSAAAGNREAGGVLIGQYSEDCRVATITQVLTGSEDSAGGRFSFKRGIVGLATMLKRLWSGHRREYYIGEWHSHPGGRPVPSSTDRRTMISIASDPREQCPEPILVLIGWEWGRSPNVGVYVFTREREEYRLEEPITLRKLDAMNNS